MKTPPSFVQALEAIESARRIDPFGPAPLEELGEVHIAMEDLAAARDAFEQAVLFSPDDANLNFKLGVAHWRLGGVRRGQSRRTALAEARAYFARAHDLSLPEDRGWSLHWLGRLHTDAGEFDEAITCLRRSRARDVAPLSGGIYLAQAYLRNRQFEHAESTATEVIASCKKLISDDPLNFDLNTSLPQEESDSILGVLLCFCEWVIAYSRAQRGFPDEADKALASARAHAKQLNDAERKRWCQAGFLDCAGFSAYVRGDFVSAERQLRESLKLLPDAETYMHLAMTLSAQRGRQLDPALRRDLSEKVLGCTALAVALDASGQYAAQLRELESAAAAT